MAHRAVSKPEGMPPPGMTHCPAIKNCRKPGRRKGFHISVDAGGDRVSVPAVQQVIDRRVAVSGGDHSVCGLGFAACQLHTNRVVAFDQDLLRIGAKTQLTTELIEFFDDVPNNGL
jgi:hypothetical protein